MNSKPLVSTLLAAGLLLGCGGLPYDQADDPPAILERDIKEYDELGARLEAHRQDFVSDQYLYPYAVGTSFFFLHFPGWDPRLHRFDTATGQRIDYDFSIGSGDAFHYRASSTLIVTAARNGEVVDYFAYDAAQANSLVAKTSFPSPKDEQRWWAYAVSRESVYVVTVDRDTQLTWLERWSPRSGGVERLCTLEAATGQSQLGIFLDFNVDDGTMLFLEGGRLWSLDLATQRATWLKNETEITGTVDFLSDGVVYESAAGLFYYHSGSGRTVRLDERILQQDYRLNETYKNTHAFDGDFSRWGDWVVYGSVGGIHAFNLTTEAIVPLLLEPRDAEVRIVYRYPTITSDGTMFVTGLESASGSVGAEGPIYRYDLKAVLQ